MAIDRSHTFAPYQSSSLLHDCSQFLAISATPRYGNLDRLGEVRRCGAMLSYPEPDFSPESTTRGEGCPDGPSKQAFGPKIEKMLAKSRQNFINFQKFQISAIFNFIKILTYSKNFREIPMKIHQNQNEND